MSFKKPHPTLTVPCFIAWVSCFAALWLTPVPLLFARQPLKYSCSNQIYKAFEFEKIALFRQETGIPVDVFTASSGSAVFRLMNGSSDIASSARPFYPRQSTFGYHQIPFCMDPIAVIVHANFPVEELSHEQLKTVFSGRIANWKAVTPYDCPVWVIVPDKSTAAYKNFHYQVLKHKPIEYDVSVQNTAMVIEAVKNFPMGAISFISHGAAMQDASVKALRINGHAPREIHYPYSQTFYYLTKDVPSGQVRQFIDFTFSPAGQHIMIKNGMLPILRRSEDETRPVFIPPRESPDL